MDPTETIPTHPRRVWRRVGVALAAVGAGMYLPFGWLLVTVVRERDHSLRWIEFWPILPGFVPGAYLYHPSRAVEFAVMGVMTLGVLASLVCLGASSPRRLGVAVGVALLISVPSSVVAYTCFRS